jgi:SAM-dependent methyltransferase
VEPVDTAASWDAQYAAGRYSGERPVEFVADILAAARHADLIGCPGLYVGCGNGRNYLPLVAGGLDLVGLDISATALDQLAARAPGCRDRLVHGDLSALPPEATYSLVTGIQGFQHGDRYTAHATIRAAQRRVAPGGLFCLRVNAAGTDVAYKHEVVQREADEGFTLRYLDGPKRGLLIHFFSEDELASLFGEAFRPVLPLRLHRTWRKPPGRGQWSQWEAIWQRVC